MYLFHFILALKLLLSIGTAPAFQKFGVSVHHNPIPPCQHYLYLSHEYLECHLRYMTFTIWHDVGTNRMGTSYDPTSVVDPQLR